MEKPRYEVGQTVQLDDGFALWKGEVRSVEPDPEGGFRTTLADSWRTAVVSGRGSISFLYDYD